MGCSEKRGLCSNRHNNGRTDFLQERTHLKNEIVDDHIVLMTDKFNFAACVFMVLIKLEILILTTDNPKPVSMNALWKQELLIKTLSHSKTTQPMTAIVQWPRTTKNTD